MLTYRSVGPAISQRFHLRHQRHGQFAKIESDHPTCEPPELTVTFYVDDEIASQPACWRRAAELAPMVAHQLPSSGERVAFVGCGTSWFVAQVIAHWRESHGLGESDAFTASELPARDYQRVVAFTRSAPPARWSICWLS